MYFEPFEVTTPHVIYALLGAFIVLFGMFSLFLRERLYVGEAIWAFVFGVIIGPYCANIFDPRDWSSSSSSNEAANVITLEFTRVVLAIGVFAIGVELPKAYMLKHWRSLTFLLVPVMTWGWFVSAGFICALIPPLNFLSSLAVAACLTPTDPILASAVVGGKWADKHVPAHIRHLLAAESGCNDGAAFPFLFLALYLIINDNVGHAIRDWFLILWLYEICLGIVIGCTLGFAFRHLMKFCQRHDLIDRQSYVAQYVSLAILTIGVTTLLGSDDLLAAFFCGTAFAWDGFFNKQTEESVFSSVIDILFNVAAFIYVGAWMPFNKFQDSETELTVWRLIVIAILVLILRRLPAMVALYRWIPDIKTFREAVFSGHFGPIGIGAVFLSTLAMQVLHDAHQTSTTSNDQLLILKESIQPIVAFMVLCSITIHGLSIPSFSLGRRVHSVSRTWSRRDTGTLTRTSRGQPEWVSQARMVTRPEDVIINRDREDLDVEAGLEKSLSGVEDFSRPSAEMEQRQEMEELELKDTQTLPQQQQDFDAHFSRTSPSPLTSNSPTWTPFTTRPSTPTTGAVLSNVHKDREGEDGNEKEREHDYREENPPYGTEDDVSEWIEGKQKVIERRTEPGRGSDVEVTVVNAEPLSGPSTPRTKLHGVDLIKTLHLLGHRRSHSYLPDIHGPGRSQGRPSRTSTRESSPAREFVRFADEGVTPSSGSGKGLRIDSRGESGGV